MKETQFIMLPLHEKSVNMTNDNSIIPAVWLDLTKHW